MEIQFTKAKHEDKASIFKCVRDDGSSTWMETTPHFIEHDIVHYAVESVLGYKGAFYGLVASGWDIESFEEREEFSRRVRTMPLQAPQTEQIVLMMQIDLREPQPYGAFIRTLRSMCDECCLQVPQITSVQLEDIREQVCDLLDEWRSLEPGATLRLEFPPRHAVFI